MVEKTDAVLPSESASAQGQIAPHVSPPKTPLLFLRRRRRIYSNRNLAALATSIPRLTLVEKYAKIL